MSKKIRWGVLSTANIGVKKVIPGMQQGEFCEVTAIASRGLEKAQAAARELGIAKAYGSEEAFRVAAMAVQVHGGAGFIKDYGVEQDVRDAKIFTIYEGTTHIQALDLFFRKIARDGGETLRHLLEQVKATCDRQEGGEALANERMALLRALGDVESILGTMMEKVSESLYHVGLQGNRILFALAETVIAWLLVRQAAVALERKQANPGEATFYDSKVAVARWFCHEVLPGLGLTRRLVEHSSLALMELPEEVF